MQKIISTALFCIILTQSYGQKQRFLSSYLQLQYNKTIYDRTTGNNPWGIGAGLQLFFNNKSKFKPTIDFTADTYLEDDKVLRLNEDSIPADNFGGMVNLFAGVSYHPTKRTYFSLVGGPSFIGGRTLIGIKPSFGFYFSETQRWTGKISFINIFNRDKKTGDDFGSLSLSIGLKLF